MPPRSDLEVLQHHSMLQLLPEDAHDVLLFTHGTGATICGTVHVGEASLLRPICTCRIASLF